MTVTGTSTDAPPQETALHPTPQSKGDGDYDARRLRGAPVEYRPNSAYLGPCKTRGCDANRYKEGLREVLHFWG